MLRTLMRSAHGRITVAVVTSFAAVGLAVPASAGLLDTASGSVDPLHTTSEDVDALLGRLDGTCEAAMEIPARLLTGSTNLAACDLRGTLVRAGSLAVRVPSAGGTGVRAASLVTEDAPQGTVTELSIINTGRRIRVDVLRLGDEPARHPGPKPHLLGGAGGACSTAAYAYIGTRNDALRWHLNPATTPSYLQADLATKAIVDGARNLARGANDCGLRPLSNVTEDYLGTTSRHASCQGPDGQSTVDFGGRPRETLATACWWYKTGDATQSVFEADIRFQDDPGTFYSVEPLDCDQSYALTGVATHEFGHTFGLAHISEERHPQQTMSPAAPACSYDQTTLGRGDWLGLRNLYGD